MYKMTSKKPVGTFTLFVQELGTSLTGTRQKIEETLRRMNIYGPYDYYWSGTRGEFMLRGEMNVVHVANALKLRYRHWANGLSSIRDLESLMKAVREGPTNDEEFVKLYAQLQDYLVHQGNASLSG